MPDHLHLLVRGECESSEGRNFISLAKQYSGYYYKKQFKEPLWQRYGYERTLRNDEGTLMVARYILENPVRAKLVANVEDYPFVGSLAYDFKDLLESIVSDRRAPDDQIEL
jgi:REP element-mobilizing transposase RayT